MTAEIIEFKKERSAEGVTRSERSSSTHEEGRGNNPFLVEDVNGVEYVLGSLDMSKIEDLVVIYVDTDGVLRLRANDLTYQEIIYMMEKIKFSLLGEREM